MHPGCTFEALALFARQLGKLKSLLFPQPAAGPSSPVAAVAREWTSGNMPLLRDSGNRCSRNSSNDFKSSTASIGPARTSQRYFPSGTKLGVTIIHMSSLPSQGLVDSAKDERGPAMIQLGRQRRLP